MMKILKLLALIGMVSNLAWTMKVESDQTTEEAKWRKRAKNTLAEVDNNNWLKECVPPFKANGFSDPINYSNYYLRDKKSGLCADHMACAFEECTWTDEAKNILESSDLNAVDFSSIKNLLPPSNLPAFTAFPQNVRQLVDVIKLARKTKKGLISVKSSGHSYHGSSTMRDSTQINLRNLTKYAANGIIECKGSFALSSKNRACALALARGKQAIIRVGGGEPHDSTYRAVLEWNKIHNNKYLIVGGGAGTVVAGGGWLQGGGLSTGVERLYGYGVDQVLEIEMVLVDGTHIKFGPTKWVAEKGFTYPKTTKVEGFCNSNLVDDETKWKWTTCETKIPFADLWFAIRGGGGGTYGIVTAIQVQLHPYAPLYVVYGDGGAALNLDAVCKTNCSGLDILVYDFFIDLFFNPIGVGLTESISNACGSPGFTFSTTGTIFGSSFQNFFCLGTDVTNAVIGALKTYVTEVIVPKFPKVPQLADALFKVFNFYYGGSFAEIVMQYDEPNPRVPVGHIQDNPPPGTQVYGGYLLWSANVPIKWLVQKNDEVHYFLSKVASNCHLMGGKTDVAHDQMTAINQAQRISGLQCIIPPELEGKYRKQFLPYFKTQDGKFPGGTEYNHVGPKLVGPLKSDWTQPCPLDFTKTQQRKQCVSLVESVWGTDMLARLEKTKRAVDPSSVLQCYFCVGEKSV